jgi:hypothetical protein
MPVLPKLVSLLGWLSVRRATVSAVISYCTTDYRFVGACIAQALRISDEVVVVSCDHFFDGTPENRELLDRTRDENPRARFVEFPFDAGRATGIRYWHNLARLTGVRALERPTRYVLFLDADEIVEGDRMRAWLDRGGAGFFTAQRLASYWYFREPFYQATTLEDSALLVRRDRLTEAGLMGRDERASICKAAGWPQRRGVLGPGGRVLVHHYSWVRTKEEMLRKVRTWGHAGDRDWVRLIEEEFSGPFRGTDFVHGYQYRTVEPFIQG